MSAHILDACLLVKLVIMEDGSALATVPTTISLDVYEEDRLR